VRVVVVVEIILTEQVVLAALVVEAMAGILQLAEPLIQVVVVVVQEAILEEKMAAQAALALSSLKYLTTYPQHSLVALHRACPHLSLGSTSTL
jgi:hypothetical protein